MPKTDTQIQEIFSLMHAPTEEDKKLVQKAYDFAVVAHTGHTRKSGEPYFTHLFATAKILAELGMSATTVAAGFLHDTIEDTQTTEEDIEREFGKEILFLVEGVTKLGHIKYRGATRHNESLRKLFVAMSQDIRVLIVKLCDRLHNMQTLEYVPAEKQLRIAKETLEIYAPIAYRLGIRKLNRELEDNAFKYVYPEEYREISAMFKERQKIDLVNLEKFNNLIKKELAKEKITEFRTDFRIKGLYSLYKKLKRREMDIEKIHDISALRVIVPTVADCYRVLGIVHSAWRPLPGRIKDYIAFPKPNGYQSIHTTIFTGDGAIVEVQIKTEQMYRESEYGIASHISYKEGEKGKTVARQNFGWLLSLIPTKYRGVGAGGKLTLGEKATVDVPHWVQDLVEYQKGAGEDFIDDIKNDFFDDRIFVFTPKGDVVDLPKDSSVVDFAYSIHSDIGNKMSGGKVNGKLVTLATVLQNGDRVEIQTKKSAKPSYKWLEHCKTTMAKRHIQHFLDGEKK